MARLSLFLVTLEGLFPIPGLGSAQGEYPGGEYPRSQEGEVAVRRLSPAMTEVEPREIVILSFQVENASSEALLLREEFSLPTGWTSLFPPSEFSLASGENAARLVGVQPGSLAPGGEQQVRYGVRSLTDPTVRGEAQATVRLREVHALDLLGVGERVVLPLFSGEATELSVRVVNRGNAAIDVQVGVRLDLAAQVEVTPSTLSLEPGESALVRLRITADPGLSEALRRILTVTASTPHEVAGHPVSARVSIPVEGVPLRAGGDPWLRYPVTASAFRLGHGARSAMQVTLFGDGFLDEAHRRRFQFFVRGPDRQGRTPVHQYSEIWGVLELPWVVLSAGDRAFTLSELSAQSRDGRGGGVDLHPFRSPLVISAFHVEDGVQLQERTDWGVAVSLGSGRRGGNFRDRAPQELRLNYLAMEWEHFGDTPSYREQVTTLEARLDAGATLRLEGEVARSTSTKGGGAIGEAWRLQATGRLGTAWDYQLRGRWAGPDFSGRLSDSADYEARLSFPMGLGIRGTLGAQRFERNLDAVSARGAANRETLLRGGASLPLPGRVRLSVDMDVYDRDDARADLGRRVEQQRVRVGVSQTRGSFSYRGEVRTSEARDRADETTQYGLNYGLALNYRPHPTFSLNGQARFGRDDTPRDSRLGRETSDYSGSVQWQPMASLRLRATATQRQQHFPDDPLRERQDREHYSAGFDLVLSATQELRGDLRRSESRFGVSETVLGVGYQRKLNVPFARKASMGNLTGEARILTAEGSVPLPNARVRVGGASTRTDSEGRFVFRTLPVGEHAIALETSDLGVGIVAASEHPGRVLIQGGGRWREIRLLYLEGATVRGVLHVMERESATPGQVITPASPGARFTLAGVLVELAQGVDVRRTLTDRDGSFRFQLLPPGPWTLRVYPQGLPSLHRLEREIQEIQVIPGQDQTVNIAVLPVERRIRFLDEGQIRIEPPAGTDGTHDGAVPPAPGCGDSRGHSSYRRRTHERGDG